VRRFGRFVVSILCVILAVLIAESITADESDAQFPVMAIDTAVRNRLAEEWEPINRYQHERGYCVQYTTEYAFSWGGPLVVYTLKSVTRAAEENTTASSIRKMTCPTTAPPWVFLHVHPPTQCRTYDESSCELGGALANQCYPSTTDMRTLNNSDKPFSLIQCDEHAIVPYWRTAP
jgi:hypothetical protein